MNNFSIQNNIKGCVSSNNFSSLNKPAVQSMSDLSLCNKRKLVTDVQSKVNASCKQVKAGERVNLVNTQEMIIQLGWHILDPRCDVDCSIFGLDRSGKCPSDDWFIFYGNPQSSDCSLSYECNSSDKADIHFKPQLLSSGIQKLVFVITINEALQKGLNFAMLDNVRFDLIDKVTQEYIFSFPIQHCYSGIISMVVGELYIRNGQWKFNAVGNGVASDLSKLCNMYGIAII